MMKRLAGIVLGLSSVMALQTTVFAQVSSETVNRVEKVPVTQGSEVLMIEPISIDHASQAAYLKAVSNSVKAKPDSSSSFLDNIPTDLIHTPSFPSTDTSAINFFQVPPPAPSVGININTK
jgi:hypothetical protein